MKLHFVIVKRYSFKVLLFFVISPCILHLRAYSITQTSVQTIQRPFDTIGHLKKEDRTDAATLIYKRNFRHVKEALAMQYLDQLSVTARKLDDKVLESVVFDLKADYYSVNKQFNNLSIANYQKAINFSNNNDLPLQTAIYLHHEGMFYYNYKRNTIACLYFLKSQDKFKEIGFNKVPNMGHYYNQVADFYYHLGDYDNAKAQLQEALKYEIKSPRDRVNVINTIGLIYRNYNQYTQALAYFNKALNLARKNRDTIWISIATGNIGSVYFMQDQYNKALPYIQTDYNQSLKYGEKINATIALLRLVKINLEKNKIHRALKQLDTAELLIYNSQPSVLNLMVNIYDLKAHLYDKMGLSVSALNYRKKYEEARDSLNLQNNVDAVEIVKMQWVIDKHLTEENKLKTKAEFETNERNTVFIALFPLIIVSVVVYRRQVLKTKKNNEILRSEKRRVDEELKHTELKLHSYTENLKENNMLIENFKEQIDHLKNKNADVSVVKHLEELMQAHIMTDDTWMEFKKIFLKVYPNFFFNLKKNFLYLSETDIRLLTLIKLQSNNKEMANMLGITVEGVKKAKQRLKKKMNLNETTTIEEAILKT